MADAILSNVSNDQTNLNPATEAKPKSTEPPKGIPFPKAQHRTERPIDMREIESVVAKTIGYRLLEGKSLELAMEAGLKKAREMVNQLARQNAKDSGSPYREATNFLMVWCDESGISQVQDCLLAHEGRKIATESFQTSVKRIAKLIKEVSDGQTALKFVEQAKSVRGGRDGRRLLEEPRYVAIIKSLI